LLQVGISIKSLFYCGIRIIGYEWWSENEWINQGSQNFTGDRHRFLHWEMTFNAKATLYASITGALFSKNTKACPHLNTRPERQASPKCTLPSSMTDRRTGCP
jgi:hypothetical protein